MSLNNIKLSHLIVGEWYPDNTLVPSGNPPIPSPAPPVHAAPEPVRAAPEPLIPKTPAPEPGVYKFLGNNRRKISIIVNSPNTPFLPDAELTFLTKVLEACRLNIGDVAIVNHHTAPVNITTLRSQLQPANILLFGVEPTTIQLPINFPAFKPQPYDNCTYLAAPPLDQLSGNDTESKLLKSKLWVCLKTLFDV